MHVITNYRTIAANDSRTATVVLSPDSLVSNVTLYNNVVPVINGIATIDKLVLSGPPNTVVFLRVITDPPLDAALLKAPVFITPGGKIWF